MACFIDTHEAEISILPHFAILGPIDDERCIACSAKFGGVGVINLEGDGLAAEPITDIVCIAVVHSYSDGVVEDHFKVCKEIWVNKVTCFLECVINIVVGFRVV